MDFACVDHARTAIDHLDQKEFMGRRLTIRLDRTPIEQKKYALSIRKKSHAFFIETNICFQFLKLQQALSETLIGKFVTVT